MRGNETFRHAVTRMKASAASVIERAGLTADDIQLIIPHQANLRIINAVAQRLSIPEDKVFVNIEKYGNTSAAAVAIAFDEARRSGRFGKGDNVVLVTFGAGLTWGAAAHPLVISVIPFQKLTLHMTTEPYGKKNPFSHPSFPSSTSPGKAAERNDPY
ncbi:MAG: 3-oxoacyl-[acyl-carrier-protein] synthase III C-terminal domain-containing protein [Akkermansia sp.]